MAANEPEKDGSDIPEAMFAEAARWFARLRETNADAKLHAAFERWKQHDARHPEAYEQAGRLWQVMNEPAKHAAAENTQEIAALIAAGRKGKKHRAGQGAIGLLAILAIAFAIFWWHAGGLDNLQADYVTAPGEHARHVLADGTVIDLNTDTAVAVTIEPDRRAIRIFRGEAFVTVAHDDRRSMTVTTRDGHVMDVGTAFNVRVNDEQTVVSLVEGKVEVSALADLSRVTGLYPGQQIVVNTSGLGKIAPFDASAATAWRSGNMIFYQTRLDTVVRELNRYRRGRIVILSDRLRALPVTGIFSTRDPAEALHIIEATLGVSALNLTDALTVLH